MMIFVVPIIGVIVLVVFYALEQRANDKRIANGEEPRRHHDITDQPAPLSVIDWTRRF